MEMGLTQILLNAVVKKQEVKKDTCCHGKLKKKSSCPLFSALSRPGTEPTCLLRAGFSLKSWPLANLMGNIRKAKDSMFSKTPSNLTEVSPNGTDSCLGS